MRTASTASSLLVALMTAAAVGGLLSGCTPAVPDESGPTTAPAAAGVFQCPSASQVAGLTAAPFSLSSSTSESCHYATENRDDRSEIVISYGATSGIKGIQTLSAPRRHAEEQGLRVRSAEDLSDGAFTAGSSTRCAAWVYASDGVVTRVAVERPAAAPSSACAVAKSVSVLMGTARAAAEPQISVIAADGLLSTTAKKLVWKETLADAVSGRTDVTTEAGDSWASGFSSAIDKIAPETAAIVFLSGTKPAQGDQLAALQSVSAVLSKANSQAPRARLIVVGPVTGSDASPATLQRQRSNLRTATEVAAAEWIDPSVDDDGAAIVGRSAQLRIAEERVVAVLENDPGAAAAATPRAG